MYFVNNQSVFHFVFLQQRLQPRGGRRVSQVLQLWRWHPRCSTP